MARSPRAARGNGKETSLVVAQDGTGTPNGGAAPGNPASTSPYQVTYGARSAGIVLGTGADWFGPLNPMVPVAPPEVAGRIWDMPSGYNLNIQPRAYEAVQFPTLRALADGYDLLRLIIETRKDQMARLKWNILPRDKSVKVVGAVADRVKTIESFFLRPDKVHFWDGWLRMLMEDLLVIDAPSVYVRRTMGNALYALEIIDGATIKRVIDDWGRTPEPPIAAYQQVLKGFPAIDYTTDDLIYAPRNVRAHKVYGYSPVEQILMTVNIALRRQVFQLDFFTEGNIPEALIGVPETWTPDQIRQFQDWFDSILMGNLAERRRARFVPNAVGKTYIPTKDNELFGKAEEWMARVCCFAFGVSPQPFVHQMNRATAETAEAQALQDGLAPIQAWVKNFIDTIIVDLFNEADLEFSWEDDREVDPNTQMEILTGYATKGIMTLNEARGELGLDAYENPEFNKPMVMTATGYVLIATDDVVDAANNKTTNLVGGQTNPVTGEHPVDPNNPEQPNQQTQGQNKGQPAKLRPRIPGEPAQPANEQTPPAAKLAKAAAKGQHIPFDRPKTRRGIAALSSTLHSGLTKLGASLAAQVEKKLGKADDDDDADSLVDSLDFAVITSMGDDIEEDLFSVAFDSGKLAVAQVGPGITGKLTGVVNDRASAWAAKRAAQLVSLTGDPSLTQATRDMMKATISDALSGGASSSEVADALQESYAFSEERADLIANTEIRRANSGGALEGYKTAAANGVDVQKGWLVDDDPCPVCEENEADGPIDLDDTFSSGDDAPPAHPNCDCAITPVVTKSDGDEDEDSDDEED